MKKYAVIDIGTNSAKILIGEVEKKYFSFLLEKFIVCRLGEDFSSNNILTESAMQRTEKAISTLLDVADSYKVENVIAFGTMALRTAKNGKIFVERVKNKLGLNIEILSGEDEAFYSYKGVVVGAKLDDNPVLIFDTGGGSTEFIVGNEEKIFNKFSYDIGAVSLTEKFELDKIIDESILNAANEYIKSKIKTSNLGNGFAKIIGIGGNVTTLSTVALRTDTTNWKKANNFILTKSELDKQIQLYSSLNKLDREKIIGLPASRADIILGGALITKTILDISGMESLYVSTYGLRHGAFYEYFIKNK